MSDIEREFMECPDHGKRTHMRIEHGEPLRCRDCGKTLVEVRYVRADNHRGAVDLLEQAVSLIAQPTIPDHARKRWQVAVDELLGDASGAGRQ